MVFLGVFLSRNFYGISLSVGLAGSAALDLTLSDSFLYVCGPEGGKVL